MEILSESLFQKCYLMKTTEEAIEQLKNLDLSSCPREEILKLIKSIYTSCLIMTVTIPKGKCLFRSRPNDDVKRFFKKEDLSFVPQKNNLKYRRASTPNNTMFYASTSAPNLKSSKHDLEVTFTETIDFLRDERSIDYAKITCGTWFLKEDLHLLAMIPYNKEYDGVDFVSDMKNSYNKNLSNISKEELSTYSTNFLDFISNEFQKDVQNDYDYMISAIFTELLMKNKSVDGVFYPSVQSDSTCYNVAVTPESVEKLNLVVAMECSVFKNKGQIEFCEDAIVILNGNENFNWIERNTEKFHSEILEKIGLKSIGEMKLLAKKSKSQDL